VAVREMSVAVRLSIHVSQFNEGIESNSKRDNDSHCSASTTAVLTLIPHPHPLDCGFEGSRYPGSGCHYLTISQGGSGCPVHTGTSMPISNKLSATKERTAAMHGTNAILCPSWSL